jgi:hypothetical protein
MLVQKIHAPVVLLLGYPMAGLVSLADFSSSPNWASLAAVG